MKTKYIKGQGIMILFGPDKTEMKMALDTLVSIRRARSGYDLDGIIFSLQKDITPRGYVLAICEMCWTPINLDTNRKLYLADGRCVHETCP